MKINVIIVGFVAILLSGCNGSPSAPVRPPTPKAIQGLYIPNPKIGHFAGCTIRLGDGVFAYMFFTDVANDAAMSKNPRCGSFTLEGSQVTLLFSDGKTEQWILTQGKDGYLLWEAQDYQKYLQTHNDAYLDGALVQRANL